MSIIDIHSPPQRIGPESNGMMMTPEEYDAIEDWDEFYRYELVREVLIVSPIPDITVRSQCDYLGYLIYSYQEGSPPGSCVSGTLYEQMIRTNGNRWRADRAIWVGLGRTVDTERDVPAIVIEFVSNRSRDRHRDYVEKRRDYAQAGVQEYWVIDRFRRTMTVFRGEKEPIVVEEGEVYQLPLLPGFELPLDHLFADADQFEQTDD